MEQDWTRFDQTVPGAIEIAPEVIEVIAGMAAMEIQGVDAMSGNFVGDIRERFGQKNFGKGIRVAIGQQGVTIDVSVVIGYRQSIPHVANQLQQHMKRSVETMTSLSVKSINIYVTDVALPDHE